MAQESVFDTIERSKRSPRVHMRYDVQVGDAIEQRELPFVVGVMGDYSGNNSPVEKKPLADRDFTRVDAANFDSVMASVAPGLNIRVENTLAGDGSEIGVDLQFRKLEDFEPGAIVQQVPELRELLETRNQLRDLMANASKKPVLERRLEEILQETDKTKSLGKEVGVDIDDA